ncbi:MAG: LD-carboxypeptidase [Bdellovibrionales bacterium]|nr:LD-carboxypeptidase [Bdellovibrionales bacterium]
MGPHRRKVGIWAGSSPGRRQDTLQGIRKLRAEGMDVVLPTETARYMSRPESKTRAFLAGPDAAKIKAFVRLWNDPKIHDIFCVRGGHGTLRLLPLLDKVALKKGPKCLWGFSDLTILQNYLFGRFGLPWMHSPHVNGESLRTPQGPEIMAWRQAFAQHPNESTRTHSLKLLHAPKKLPSKLRLPMIGGNLTCLAAMLGTPWQPRPSKPFFLFLEETNEAPYRTDRLLQQLSSSGMLRQCRGVILGHFTDCPHGIAITRLWAQEQGLTLWSGLPAGHEYPNIPFPMGVPLLLETKKGGASMLRVPIPQIR